jgi:hypothetical protein
MPTISRRLAAAREHIGALSRSAAAPAPAMKAARRAREVKGGEHAAVASRWPVASVSPESRTMNEH